MLNQANVDVLSANGPQGDVAMRLLQSGFNIQSLRVNGVLRKDEMRAYDTAVLEVARRRLIGVQDLIDAGCTYSLPNALGKTSVEWEKMSHMEGAEISMSGITQGSNDSTDFGLQNVPLPIIHKDFHLNIRRLTASRENGGTGLDTSQASQAATVVTEAIENLLFHGTTALGPNNIIHGYTSAPDRITGSVTTSWLTASGEQILDDVLSMITLAEAQNMYGPFIIYVPNAVHTKLQNDFKANSDKSIISRLLEVTSIKDIKPTSDLKNTNVLMIQMTQEVIDIVDGIQPTVVQWATVGGMQINFKVMAIMVPRVKSDYNAQSGLIHFS